MKTLFDNMSWLVIVIFICKSFSILKKVAFFMNCEYFQHWTHYQP